MYEVIPNHIHGFAVVRGGTLVDICPSVESAERIAAALNELETADLHWALPALSALKPNEMPRVVRALAKRMRQC